MDDLMKSVIANNKLLNSCSRHSFDIDLLPERLMGKRWRCSKSNGEVDSTAKMWYEDGLKHGGSQDESNR